MFDNHNNICTLLALEHTWILQCKCCLVNLVKVFMLEIYSFMQACPFLVWLQIA